MRLVFSQVIVDVLQVRCGGWRPADTHQELSIRSIRASISSSSINSPRSAWAMPSRTAARKRASCSSRRKTASFTSRSVSVPAWLAIWDSCASCSGVKWTSMSASVGTRVYAVNGRCLARVSGDNSGFSVKRFETLLSGGAALPKNSDDLIPADVAMSTYNYDTVGNLLSITRATVPANNGLAILSFTPQAGFVGRFKSRFSLERTLL